MAKDKNVISLEERRKQSGKDGEDSPSPQGGEPLPGKLIWLHCPTCNTLEYTELFMPGGRVHNVCGTQVMEAAIELDLRSEVTVTRINLERLNILENLLGSQRKVYEEYLNRLALAAGRAVEGYPVEEANLQSLPVAEVDAFGLLVSEFFHNPMRHFGAESGGDPPESAPDAPDNPED